MATQEVIPQKDFPLMWTATDAMVNVVKASSVVELIERESTVTVTLGAYSSATDDKIHIPCHRLKHTISLNTPTLSDLTAVSAAADENTAGDTAGDAAEHDKKVVVDMGIAEDIVPVAVEIDY